MNKYKYILIAHDYKKKQSKIVFQCHNKYNCMQMVQDLSEEYIRNLVGNNHKINYYVNGNHGRDYGYFIEKNLYNNNSLTVKHKYIKSNGYLWNDVVIDDVICYYFIEDVNNKKTEYENNYCHLSLNEYFCQLKNKFDIFPQFNDCLKEMKKKVIIKD